jgi:8-oxo-dGTP pyrophosphatase MutT (NUDIX family)
MVKKCICGSAIVMNDGKTLLIKHKKLGVWLNPGGHIEENETPEETALREVKEETGLDVEIIEDKSKNKIKTNRAFEKILPFSIMYEFVNYKTGMHEHFDMIYLVRPMNSVEIKPDYGEVTEIGWFSENEIDNLETYESTKIRLHNAFALIKNMKIL